MFKRIVLAAAVLAGFATTCLPQAEAGPILRRAAIARTRVATVYTYSRPVIVQPGFVPTYVNPLALGYQPNPYQWSYLPGVGWGFHTTPVYGYGY